MCIALANNFPKLSFTVQDYKAVVDKGRELVPEPLKHRIDFQAHDFLTPQTVNADVYILAHVCHDWPLADAARILKNIVPAMKPTSRILLLELVTINPANTHYTNARHMG